MRKIIFRADGNAQIGLGHVMRCLALAQMLGPDYDRRFAIVQPSPEVMRLIQEKGFVVITLKTNDLAEFLAILRADDVVVLDGYSFPETYQRTIRELAKKLVFIDDLVEGHQVANVVINHAGGVETTDYQSEPQTKFCLGPPYVLLRPEFFEPQTPPPAKGPIFISLGGADPGNILVHVLDAVVVVNPELEIRAVLGPMYQFTESLVRFRELLPNLTLLQNLSAAEILAQIQQCQLAITACSTVSYEVCAVNRPLIAIQTAKNQDRLAMFLSEQTLALPVIFNPMMVEHGFAFSDVEYRSALRRFFVFPKYRQPNLEAQRRFFDGQSPERFRQLFAQLCA
jgi:UDP-2,4-diacetamido-2,4,6-trideoxy-beta-L-altropyranose hydrolase